MYYKYRLIKNVDVAQDRKLQCSPVAHINFFLKSELPVLVGPLSTIQPFNHPLTSNFSWSSGLYQEYSVRVFLEKPFHSRFCAQPTYGAQEYQTYTDTALSRYHFKTWRFTSFALRNSRQTSVGIEPWTSRSTVERATTEPTRHKPFTLYLLS